jgi:site-specific recombinase XerD
MMAKTKPSRPSVTGPLAQYADGFRAELARLGYTPLTTASQLRLMAHLSRWLAAEGLDAPALTAPTAERYFADRRSVGYANERTVAALGPLLGCLRRLGAVPVAVAASPATATGQLLARYQAYLTVERGLAASTAGLNARLLRPFLDGHAARHGGRLDVKELTAGDVTSFVLEQSARRSRSVKRIVSALRSFLGFLYVEGLIGQPLAKAVPSPPGWTLAGLPRALPDSEVAALLASCDAERPAGQRDLAILTLLARLGLRAGEVAALRLDDIDWRRGELVVRGKAGRTDRLPLPADVGEKIAAYLRDCRPGSAGCRAVFITALAPHRPLSPGGVTTVVAAAGRRAGLGTIHAHRLRHSAATAMLRAGGSLREIGDVLRHRRAMTTAIYAKLDLEALRRLARPWPEVA